MFGMMFVLDFDDGIKGVLCGPLFVFLLLEHFGFTMTSKWPKTKSNEYSEID